MFRSVVPRLVVAEGAPPAASNLHPVLEEVVVPVDQSEGHTHLQRQAVAEEHSRGRAEARTAHLPGVEGERQRAAEEQTHFQLGEGAAQTRSLAEAEEAEAHNPR